VTSLAELPTNGASRVIYFGTPDIAVDPLRALVDAGCNVELVVTRPDVRRGRGNQTSACPVKVAAQEMGLKVSHSLSDVVALVSTSNDLLGVVVAYGELISMDVLSVVPMINVHFSLLPRWRGAAPVERAILAGDETTGVCIMRVVESLDQGEVYSRVEMPILSRDTLVSLRQKLLVASLPLLVDAVKNGLGDGVAQSGEALYAKKILTSELQINWSNTATQIDRLIRVGGAYTHIGGKRLKIVKAKIGADSMTNVSYGAIKVVSRHECEVQTGSGSISLIEVQPEGKAIMKVDGWLNGARIETGAVLG
jgi:methionyl-tRNA formyltransferase